MLCVFSVWKVRSLQHQLHTTNKKRKLADGLFTEEHDEDDGTSQDWEAYLDKLHTLMLAYSIAGASAVLGGPTPSSEQALGADTTQFVQAPLDVMQAYFFRAKRTASLLPHGKRLAWLQSRDVEERSEWVSHFRESTTAKSSRRSLRFVMPIGFLLLLAGGVTPMLQAAQGLLLGDQSPQ